MASAAESAACLDVAMALGLMGEAEAHELQEKLLEVVKMLSKLR